LETIERIYRLLAKRYHPDNNKTGSVEKFENITKAYKTLSNPEKRAAYDVNYEKETNHRWKTVSKGRLNNGKIFRNKAEGKRVNLHQRSS
jgi:DnaJ-class molecular chaperone